jgi:hypothetical protein
MEPIYCAEARAHARTGKYDLRIGSNINIFKHDDSKGQYAWIDYVNEEPITQGVIGDYLTSHPQLRERKRSISNADIDEIIDGASVKIGRPKKGNRKTCP